MVEILREFLTELERLGARHGDLFRPEVREELTEALLLGYVQDARGPVLGRGLGLSDREADESVVGAARTFIERARARSGELGIVSPMERLAWLQREDVRAASGSSFDDFYDYTDPMDLLDSTQIQLRVPRS